MARTLTSPAATEAAKTSGAFPRHILEIQWGGGTGTKYYSDEALSSPVTADGRVIDWGQIQSHGEPQKVGGHGELTIRIADPDMALKTLIEVKPGPQNKYVYLHLWFEGTTWPTDRITIFGGILEAPMSWDDKTGVWSMTMKGLETFYNRLLGRFIDRDAFSDVICGECEGELIPIVYGSPVSRVPCCVIDRPGVAMLKTTLQQFDDYLYIHNVATEQLFTTGSTISLIVGYPDNYEIVTGSFATPGDYTKFTLASRGSIQASGSLSGLYGAGGHLYLMIPAADVTSPTVSRGGYPIAVYNGSTWITQLITQWDATGSDIIVAQNPSTGGFAGNESYRIGRYPGQLVVWPVGTPVYELAAWTYVANWLPSQSVDAVEAKAAVNLPGGGSLDAFLKYDTSQYSVNLNNTSWNTALGRAGGDPGLTTITITNPPAYSGFSDNRVYATIKGITSGNTAGGTAFSNPADIIKDMLTNAFMGNIGGGAVNSSAFTTAAAAISTVAAFVINRPSKLMEVCAELAFQHACLFFFDGGVANIQKLSNTLSGSTLTIDEGKYSKGTLKLEETSIRETPTQLGGQFLISAAASNPTKLVRTSNDAIGYFGRRDEELTLWSIQAPTSVALILEFWLAYRLQLNQLVTLDTYLQALKLQPGDVITLNITNGAGVTILNNVLARVRALRHTPASAHAKTMEKIQVVAEVPLYSWTIDVLTPTTRNCNAAGTNPYTQGGPAGGSGAGLIPLPAYVQDLAKMAGGSKGSGSGFSSWQYPILGKTAQAISKGGSGNVNIYTGSPGTETWNGAVVVGFNKFGGCGSGSGVGSGVFVWLQPSNGTGLPYLVDGEPG